MYLNINDVPQTKGYTLEDNAMNYYALLYHINVHQYEYDRLVPDATYAEYCNGFIKNLDNHLYLWLRDVDYASYDHCDDVDSYRITWAIDCLLAYEKKADVDRELMHKHQEYDKDLPF